MKSDINDQIAIVLHRIETANKNGMKKKSSHFVSLVKSWCALTDLSDKKDLEKLCNTLKQFIDLKGEEIELTPEGKNFYGTRTPKQKPL